MWNFARLSPLPPLSSSRRRRRRRRRLLLSVSSSDQICVRSFFSPGHLLAWYSGRTDSSRSGQTAMCKPCRVGTGWAYIAHGAKVWTENSTVTRVNLGTAHLCNRTLHLAAAAVVVLHSPDLYILRQTRGSTACHSCSVKIYWIYLLKISSTLLGTFCSLLFMYFASKHFLNCRWKDKNRHFYV